MVACYSWLLMVINGDLLWRECYQLLIADCYSVFLVNSKMEGSM